MSREGGPWHKTGARQPAAPTCCATSRHTAKRGGVHHCEVSRLTGVPDGAEPAPPLWWLLFQSHGELLVAQWHENWAPARFPGLQNQSNPKPGETPKCEAVRSGSGGPSWRLGTGVSRPKRGLFPPCTALAWENCSSSSQREETDSGMFTTRYYRLTPEST